MPNLPSQKHTSLLQRSLFLSQRKNDANFQEGEGTQQNSFVETRHFFPEANVTIIMTIKFISMLRKLMNS